MDDTLRAMAEQGYTPAMRPMYCQLDDPEEEMRWINLAISKGSTDAIDALEHQHYYDGDKTEEALKLNIQASELGLISGCFNAGMLLRKLKKWDEALEFFQKGAEQGHPQSKLAIALMYYLGESKSENPELAKQEFIEFLANPPTACRDSNVLYMEIAKLYLADGDEKTAVNWFKLAGASADTKMIHEIVNLLLEKSHFTQNWAVFIFNDFAKNDAVNSYNISRYQDLIMKITPFTATAIRELPISHVTYHANCEYDLAQDINTAILQSPYVLSSFLYFNKNTLRKKKSLMP